MNKQQVEEAKQLLKGYLIEEESTELHTYSILHNIYTNAILPIKDNICFSSALVVILCHLSRPLNWLKFNIYLHQEANKPHVPLNVYGTNILRSGGGKGVTTHTINSLLGFDSIKREYIKSISTLSDDKDSIDNLLLVADAELQDSATTAGLRGVNKLLNDSFNELHITNTFGSVFFNLEEFADTLDNASAFDRDFLSTLKNLYDLGNTGAKAINERIKEALTNFGVSFLASTTEKILQDNARISKAFNNYLIGGNARRTILSMPNDEEFNIVEKKRLLDESMSLLQWHEKTRYKESDGATNLQKYIYLKIKNLVNLKKQSKVDITLHEDTYFYYRIYKAYCNHIKDYIGNDILCAEMEGRAWKALKISGVLLMFCTDNKDLKLDVDTFLEGVKIVEYYGHHLKRYLNSRVVSCADKVVELLLSSNNCAITQTELAHNNEVLSYNNKGETPVKFLKSQMDDVEQILSNKGYDLIVKKVGYRKKIIVYAAIQEGKYKNVAIQDVAPYKIFDNVPQC